MIQLFIKHWVRATFKTHTSISVRVQQMYGFRRAFIRVGYSKG